MIMAAVFDQYLIMFLTSPSSDFYVPKLIRQSKSPPLEPFTQARNDLGEHRIEGMQMSIVLTNLKARGLSNIEVKKENIHLSGDQVAFAAHHPNTEAPLPADVPAELKISTDISVTLQGTNEPLPGSLDMTVKHFTLNGVFNATLERPNAWNTAVTIFTRLQLEAEANASNVQVVVNIDSAFASLINEALGQPNVVSMVLEKVNQDLNTPPVLSEVSAHGTTAARSALGKLTGGGG
jgi:hypothetical protein